MLARLAPAPGVQSHAYAHAPCLLQDGCTPLHYAAHAARDAIALTLLRAGAKTDIADAEGKTASAVSTNAAITSYITNGPPPEDAA